MLKGNHAASPVLGCFPSDGAFGEVLRQLFSGERMIIELPFRNVDRILTGKRMCRSLSADPTLHSSGRQIACGLSWITDRKKMSNRCLKSIEL